MRFFTVMLYDVTNATGVTWPWIQYFDDWGFYGTNFSCIITLTVGLFRLVLYCRASVDRTLVCMKKKNHPNEPKGNFYPTEWEQSENILKS